LASVQGATGKCFDHPGEARARAAGLARGAIAGSDLVLGGLLEHLVEQHRLGTEMAIDSTGRYPGGGSNRWHAGGRITEAGHQAARGRDDQIACRVDPGLHFWSTTVGHVTSESLFIFYCKVARIAIACRPQH
jgi:hypothetical protein